MKETETYQWQSLPENSYIIDDAKSVVKFEISDCNISFMLPYIDKEFTDSFLNRFTSFTISKSSSSLIDNLLLKFAISESSETFYLLSAILQYNYIIYFENPANLKDSMTSDFQSEKENLSELLDVLHLNLKKGNSIIKSITFNTEKSLTLNNFFVVKDVFEALIKSYGLTLENFNERKQELLENTFQYKLSKIDEHKKWLLANGLANYIKSKPKGKTSSSSLRFVASFLLISQIPIRKREFEIPHFNSLKDLVLTSDINYLHTTIPRH